MFIIFEKNTREALSTERIAHHMNMNILMKMATKIIDERVKLVEEVVLVTRHHQVEALVQP
jgi:hypothetical protein